jgi:hypothetical protein
MHRAVLAFDVLAVLAFVVVGRANHGGSQALTSILHTAAPFLLAVAAGWLVARAWRRPADLRTGTVVAAVTVVGGIALRRAVFGDGIAVSFVLVTAAILGLLIVGWRTGPALLGR